MTVSVPVPRAITASIARKFALANVVVADAAGNDVVYMSRDRATIYAVGAGSPTAVATTKLRYSTNDGVTWADVYTFPEQCIGIIELDDGEVLVGTVNTGSSYTNFYRSTGWAANKLTATWTKVLQTVGGQVRAAWGMNQFALGTNGIVVVSTYNGGQTNGSGPAANVGGGRYVYLSTDFGKTFSLIYDIYTQPQAYQAVGCHVHATAYDEEWDRIWVTFGDNTGQGQAVAGGANFLQIGYSDDRGVTWNYLPCPAEWASSGFQVTTIGITKSAITFLCDSVPYAVSAMPRLGYRKLGQIRLGPVASGNSSTGFIGYSLTKAYGDEAFPMLASGVWSIVNNRHPPIWVSSMDGLDWQDLYQDPAISAAGNFGFSCVVGPTVNGKIVAGYFYTGPGGTWKSAMLSADLVPL